MPFRETTIPITDDSGRATVNVGPTWVPLAPHIPANAARAILSSLGEYAGSGPLFLIAWGDSAPATTTAGIVMKSEVYLENREQMLKAWVIVKSGTTAFNLQFFIS
jgi:hypothetical protein